MTLTSLLAPLVVAVSDLDPNPEPADVKAGYPALFLFLGLLVVVGLLGWGLSKHLRKADDNRKAGFFGDAPEVDPATQTETGTETGTGGSGTRTSDDGARRPGAPPSA